MKIRFLLACSAMSVLGAVAAGAEAVAAGGPSAGARIAAAVEGHLAVGTRMTHVYLTDSTSDSFVGTINELDEQQDYLPTGFFAQWFFTPRVGFELAWEKLVAETITANDGHSDGDFAIRGLLLQMLGRWPTGGRVTPFGGIGVGLYQGEFEEEPWWRYGYSSKTTWRMLGSTKTPRHDIEHVIFTRDPMGWLVTLGADVMVADGWDLDLSVRYVSVDLEAHYVRYVSGHVAKDHPWEEVPLDHLSFCVGVRRGF